MKRRKDGLRKGKTLHKEKEKKNKSKETGVLKTRTLRENFITLYSSVSLCKLAQSLSFSSVPLVFCSFQKYKVNLAILHEKRKVK